MADDTLFAFNQADSTNLLKLLVGGSPQGSITDPVMQTADILLGVATSTITARSGTTLGTGTAKAKWIDGSNVVQDLYDLSVLNPGSAIANGSYVVLFRAGSKYIALGIC